MVHFAIRCNYEGMERHRNEAGRYIHLKMEAFGAVRVMKARMGRHCSGIREEKAGEKVEREMIHNSEFGSAPPTLYGTPKFRR